MSEITTHKVEGQIVDVDITVHDDKSEGGAHHSYKMKWKQDGYMAELMIPFQKGPIGKIGMNGVTNEALLAIVRDRLEGFQSGSFPCDENAKALKAVKAAMNALKRRTKNRIFRKVEGKRKK